MKTLRVLIPLDGSPLSAAVLPVVCRLEMPVVTLLRVIAPPSLFGAVPPGGEAEAQEGLARAAAYLRDHGVREVTSLVREGDPAELILEVADEVEPGVIALATHGRGGLNRRAFGRVAERVIHASSFPVLAVRPNGAAAPEPVPAPLFEQVLVPSDASSLSWRAVETLELLGAAGKARVTIFGVVEEWVGAHPGAAHHAPGEVIRNPVEAFLRQRCDGLRAELDRAVGRARDLGFDATADVEVGRPAGLILERARSGAATLIAMATHGRTGVSRWVLGSITEQVLAAAPVPVLVCR